MYNVTLHCIDGKEKKKKWKFTFTTETTIIIGRIAGCHLQLNDSKVSQSHCLLQVQNSLLVCIDMGSTFGTWINGEQITTLHQLFHNDVIKLGDTLLQVIAPDLLTIPKVEEIQTIADESIVKEEDKEGSENELEETETSIESSSPKIPSMHLQAEEAVLCVFCQQELPLKPLMRLGWFHCRSCREVGEFVDRQIAIIYRVFDTPWYSDNHGILTLIEKEGKKKFLYVAKEKNKDISRLENVTEEYSYLYVVEEKKIIEDRLCLFLPFYPGKFLNKMVLETPLQAINLVLAIGTDLEKALEIWGIHGQIHSGSIYLKVDGHPLLYGYGIPRDIHYPSISWENYQSYFKSIAPEYLSRQSNATENTDIFSLAALLLELMFRQSIYRKNITLNYQEEARFYNPPRLDKRTSHLVRNFFYKALAKNPEVRFQSLANFLDALRMVRAFYKK